MDDVCLVFRLQGKKVVVMTVAGGKASVVDAVEARQCLARRVGDDTGDMLEPGIVSSSGAAEQQENRDKKYDNTIDFMTELTDMVGMWGGAGNFAGKNVMRYDSAY